MKLRNRTLLVYNGEMDDNNDYQLSRTGKNAIICTDQSSSTSRELTQIIQSKKTIEHKRKVRRRKRRKQLIANEIEIKTISIPINRSIIHIPDHILVDIFKQLLIIDRIRLERVCRRWHRLGAHFSWSQSSTFSYASLQQQQHHSISWRSNTIIDELRPRIGNDEIRGIFRRCGRHLVRIDLGAFRDNVNYSVCTSIIQYCSERLQYLSLTGIQLTNSSLNLLGRHCGTHLRAINLKRCFQESVVERGLSGFLAKCSRLQHLDVSENERLMGVPSFSHLPSDLHTLIISGCFRLSGASIESIRKQCTRLQILAMDGVDMVTADELNALFEPLGNIQTLKFGECFMTNTPGGIELVNLGKLTNIRELLLNDNLLVTNASLSAIGRGCKNLEILDISGCNRFITNEGIVELAKLPNLIQLNMSLLRNVNDEGVQALVVRGKLQSLFLHRCDQITDESIILLAKKCTDLNRLDVSYCPQVTDTSLWSLYRLAEQRKTDNTMIVCIARCGATIPSMIKHRLIEFNESEHHTDNPLTVIITQI